MDYSTYILRYVLSDAANSRVTPRSIFEIHGENNSVEISKNLARYRSQNNFIKPPK